jgi:hypothetical protein
MTRWEDKPTKHPGTAFVTLRFSKTTLSAIEEDKKHMLVGQTWEAHGFTCTLKRVPGMGHLCGYVDLPKGHPWHGEHYDDIDADVHGGLTYGKAEGDCWRIGFDCAHAGDFVPVASFAGEHAAYRDAAYVTAECESLARQAAEATKEPAPKEGGGRG